MTELRLSLDAPAELVEAIAARAAELVLEQLDAKRPAPDSPYMTVKEAAEYLRCEPQRIYDLRSAGRLANHSDGSRALVSRAELDELLGVDAHGSPVTAQHRNGSGLGG